MEVVLFHRLIPEDKPFRYAPWSTPANLLSDIFQEIYRTRAARAKSRNCSATSETRLATTIPKGNWKRKFVAEIIVLKYPPGSTRQLLAQGMQLTQLSVIQNSSAAKRDTPFASLAPCQFPSLAACMQTYLGHNCYNTWRFWAVWHLEERVVLVGVKLLVQSLVLLYSILFENLHRKCVTVVYLWLSSTLYSSTSSTGERLDAVHTWRAQTKVEVYQGRHNLTFCCWRVGR